MLNRPEKCISNYSKAPKVDLKSTYGTFNWKFDKNNGTMQKRFMIHSSWNISKTLLK